MQTQIEIRPAEKGWRPLEPEQVEELQHHMDELIQGVAFRGSHRSQQFLLYVVDKALQGSADHLKERTIGVELFQRSPSYDTGEDAIVRVTASDVRRRLLQHYGHYGDTPSRFRIHLPPGSYVPEIECYPILPPVAHKPEPVLDSTPEITVAPVLPEAVPFHAIPEEASALTLAPPLKWRLWPLALQIGLGLLLFLAGVALHLLTAPTTLASLPPWTAIFRPGHVTRLVTSDPAIEQLQELTDSNLSVSDYANQKYVLDGDTLSPEQRAFYTYYLHADNPASVDTPVAVNVARLTPRNVRLDVRPARSLRVSDMQTDDNLILLGSPRSNPWFQYFDSQLDFRFSYRKDLRQEVIENVHPLHGEQAQYIPNARGFATGESYAIVALAHSPNQSGQVLLLAGADGEGTEAAGRLITDEDRLLRALELCHISRRAKPVQDFELLLRLHTMAGSPSTVDMIACHLLAGYKS